MTWLGSAYWVCGRGKCNVIYVQVPNGSVSTDGKQIEYERDERGHYKTQFDNGAFGGWK